MSDRMSCMSFGQIMEWILEEKRKEILCLAYIEVMWQTHLKA